MLGRETLPSIVFSPRFGPESLSLGDERLSGMMYPVSVTRMEQEVPMATLAHTDWLRSTGLTQVKKSEHSQKHLPRRCMVISTGMIITGVAVPLLMVAGLLPLSVWLGVLAGFFIFAGGLAALIFCGEL
jgi:hypothetical protein